MLVRFVSSETGELLMYAESAGPLLRAMGKETRRRGTFTRFEMLPAAEALRAACLLLAQRGQLSAAACLLLVQRAQLFAAACLCSPARPNQTSAAHR